MAEKKFLILTPFLTISGGVANYYRVMKSKFSFDYDYHYVGDRQSSPGSALSNFVKRATLDYELCSKVVFGCIEKGGVSG